MVGRRQNGRQIWQEPGIVVHHAQVSLELLNIYWLRHLLNGLDFLRHRMNTIYQSSVPSTLPLAPRTHTFFSSALHLCLSAFAKHLAVFADVQHKSSKPAVCHQLWHMHWECPIRCLPLSPAKFKGPMKHHREVCCSGRDPGVCWWLCIVLMTHPVQAVDRLESCPVW